VRLSDHSGGTARDFHPIPSWPLVGTRTNNLLYTESRSGGQGKTCMDGENYCLNSAGHLPDSLEHLLVRWVGVDCRRQLAHMPGKPLRQEEVPLARYTLVTAVCRRA